MRSILSATTLLLAALGFATTVSAQSPAVSPAEADLAKQQAAQQQSQPLNNQPVWREVRSGLPQMTTQRGRETDILIQPQGQTWRALRNGQVTLWGGWLLVAMVLAVAAFYWRRGTIPLSEPPTGRKVRRFSTGERVVHWATAVSFCVLALTGLVVTFGKNILLPLLGYTLFSWLATLSKTLHNFVGPLFVVCTILIFFMFVRDNVWQRGDDAWIRKAGGLFTQGGHVPSNRFNFGEKTWFWFGVTFLGIAVGASGLVLDFPNFEQTRSTMQIANIVHIVAAIVFICLSLGHIYMGTLGVAGAYDSMRTGYVDETWAKEHHEYWYEDMKSGKIPADVQPAPTTSARMA